MAVSVCLGGGCYWGYLVTWLAFSELVQGQILGGLYIVPGYIVEMFADISLASSMVLYSAHFEGSRACGVGLCGVPGTNPADRCRIPWSLAVHHVQVPGVCHWNLESFQQRTPAPLVKSADYQETFRGW
jgi:hypothetical protein